MLCRKCPLSACRQKHSSKLVTDGELKNPDFVRDVKSFGADLKVAASEWLDFCLNLLSRQDVDFIDPYGNVVDLDIEALLPSDEDIDEGRGAAFEARIRNWFSETFCNPVPDEVIPRIRVEARERFRIVATILRAQFPCAAMMWGVRAANDNIGPIPPTSAQYAA